MKKKKNKLTWGIIGGIVLIILLIIIGRPKKAEEIAVTAENPTLKTITETIPANGKIQPVVEVKISPDVSGEIIDLFVKEGDYVEKGTLLLKIKQDFYISGRDRAAASLNSMKASLAQAEARLIQVELSYKRNKQLHEQKVITQAEFEAAEAEYVMQQRSVEAAQYNVKSSEAALKEAEENLVKTTIYAPMSGTVSKLSVERGERVVGTTQMAGTEMLRIANLNEMEVLVDVNENDIVRAKLGDTTIIEVDAYPAKNFKGLITQIANSAKTVGTSAEQVTNFEVKIFILPSSYEDLMQGKENTPFRPGMSASVTIQTETRNNVLTIPIQSVTTREDIFDNKDTTAVDNDDAGLRIFTERVFVVQADNTIKAVTVKTGIQDNKDIEITEGLSETDKIVTGPYTAISRRLKEGSKIKTDDKKMED